MSYATFHGWTEKANGSSLQGHVTVEYKKLVELFGKPLDGDGYKVDAEWIIQFEDGTIATIYNYKDGKNYCGADGTPKTQITDWHVGGFGPESVDKVFEVVEGVKKCVTCGQPLPKEA